MNPGKDYSLQELRTKLTRRIRLGEFLSSVPPWIAGSLFLWGTLILFARVFAPGLMSFSLYGGVLVAGSILVPLLTSSWKTVTDEDITALLDRQIDGKNLLIAMEETGADSEEWKQYVLEQARQHPGDLPSLNWMPVFRSIGPALLFLALIWVTPLPDVRQADADQNQNPLVSQKTEELLEKIKTVEKNNLMKEEKAERLKKKLKKLKTSGDQSDRNRDNPWAVLDSAEKEVNRSVERSSRAVSRAEEVAEKMSTKKGEGGRPDGNTKQNRNKSTSGKSGNGKQSGDGTNNKKKPGNTNEVQQKNLEKSASSTLKQLENSGVGSSPEMKKRIKKARKFQKMKKSGKLKKLSRKNMKKWRKARKKRRKAWKKLKKKLAKKHRKMHRKGT